MSQLTAMRRHAAWQAPSRDNVRSCMFRRLSGIAVSAALAQDSRSAARKAPDLLAGARAPLPAPHAGRTHRRPGRPVAVRVHRDESGARSAGRSAEGVRELVAVTKDPAIGLRAALYTELGDFDVRRRHSPSELAIRTPRHSARQPPPPLEVSLCGPPHTSRFGGRAGADRGVATLAQRTRCRCRAPRPPSRSVASPRIIAVSCLGADWNGPIAP